MQRPLGRAHDRTVRGGYHVGDQQDFAFIVFSDAAELGGHGATAGGAPHELIPAPTSDSRTRPERNEPSVLVGTGCRSGRAAVLPGCFIATCVAQDGGNSEQMRYQCGVTSKPGRRASPTCASSTAGRWSRYSPLLDGAVCGAGLFGFQAQSTWLPFTFLWRVLLGAGRLLRHADDRHLVSRLRTAAAR